MKKNEGGADDSFGSSLGDRVVWDTGSPDHECDCPGPPPQFYLPPPPRPYFLLGSDCLENSTSHLDTCEVVPVIDAEYRYSPAVPYLAIILTVAVVIVVFLLIVTFLVLLKKRKTQNLFPRKSSSQTRCDATSSNGVIYEDLTNVRPRTVSSHCPPGQTTLPSIEMIDVAPYAEHAVFAPALMLSTSPVQGRFDSRELFNPVYEELSNGSGEGGESDSEGMPQAAASEDEFAEDELSFGGEADVRRMNEDPGGSAPPSSAGHDVCREADSSDSDDRCKFLENSGRTGSLPSEHRDKGKRSCGGSYFSGVAKKPKGSDRRKVWRNKPRPPLPALPADCNEFHEGFLLKRILQIYPDVTGIGLQYSCGPPNLQRSESPPVGCGRYESLGGRRSQPEIFSPSGAMQGLAKNQSQDSSLGSDSGYSNNTSSGKPFSRPRKDYRLASHGENAVLS